MIHRSTPLARSVIGAAIAVHRSLGPGLLESAYQSCLACEFRHRALSFQQQVTIPITYRNERVDCGYRADFLLEGTLLIELKSVDHLMPIHEAQILTYLKLLKLHQGLLVNFNSVRLIDGLRNFLL